MKHLLNNISEEEKNRIREQHEGGMNLSIDNFKKLVETKLGDAKPFINEASEETCEQCGGMMKEGECVEQCGSMKEEVNEKASMDKQVAGPFSTKPNGVVKYYIYQIGSKFYIYMTNASHKEPTLMDGTAWDNDGKGYSNETEAKKVIDSVLKDPPHTFLKMKPKMMKPKMMEQNSPVGTLKDDEVEVLAKKIVDCLDGDDEMKKLLFRLNLDSKMHRTFFDKAMIEMGDYINSFGPKGPLG